MKKLKKLTLKKETITSIGDSEMGNLKGGSDYLCTGWDSCNCMSKECYTTGCGGRTYMPKCCYYGCCETIGC